MNRILKIIIFLVVCILPIKIYALGNVDVNTRDIVLFKGESGTFKIDLNNAVGRIDVSSSNTKVATISENFFFLDKESKIITVNGLIPGETTIKIVASDVSTYDSEDLSNKTYTVNVLVKDYIKGDINQNGRIDLIDITTALKKYLNNNASEEEIKFIDMNDNGKVDLSDITLLLKEYLEN